MEKRDGETPAITGAELDHYVKLIRESSKALSPLPVTLSAEWERLVPKGSALPDGIRAVLFDLYGTLFVSAAGEIAPGAVPQDERAKASDAAEMEGYFRLAVKRRHEAAKAEGVSWPEVRAEEIWAGYGGKIPAGWEPPPDAERPLKETGTAPRALRAGRETALRFELAVNPAYPMPRAEETLCSLASGGLSLGIISNAQFYSPLLFNAFFNASPAEMGFDPELLVYSFEEGEAKPSPRLFSKARERLARRNITPGETLYIGNDMRNDIIPAAEAGFVTALFAGDRRSLRLREDDPACTGRKPSMVIKDLSCIKPFKADNSTNGR